MGFERPKIYLLLTITMYLLNYTQGTCVMTELPKSNGACVASLRCDKVISDVLTSWDCITTEDYDEYYNEKRDTTYKLYINVTNVDDQHDIFESVADKMENIEKLHITDGNMFGLPYQVYQLSQTTVIEISNNQLSAVDLNRFVTLTQLTEMYFRNNSISTLEMVSQAGSMQSRSVKTIDLSHNLLEIIPNTCFSLFPELQHLNLSHNLIRSFDILTFEGVMELRILDVSHNMLFEIGNSFTRFMNLKELYVQNNKLKVFAYYNLSTLTKLEMLNLSSNIFDKFENNTFKSLLKLEYLDLSNNSIDIIPKKLFEKNNNLHSLIISKNHINHIEDGAFDGKNITKFNTQDNPFTGSIEKDTLKGVHVTELDFSNGKITSLGNETFKYMCKELRFLNFSFNLINSISHSAFSCLELLTTLDLSYNGLEELDFETGALKKLSMLYVRNNSIKNITKNIFENLDSLRNLDMSNNEITEIELQSFVGLKNIDSLSFTHNPFVNTLENNTFEGMIALKYIDLSFTRTTSYQNRSFSGLPHLKFVNGSFGQLFSIAYNAFMKTGSIEKLDLSHNLLDNFHINTSNIPKIEEIYLNDNAIRHVTNDTFSGLKLLRMLNLVNNNIQSMEAYAFKNVEQLSHLYLSSNTHMEIIGNPFDNLTNLYQVNLDSVKTRFTFQSASIQIENLDLHSCGIRDINQLFIFKVGDLHELDFGDNEILKIDKFSFQSMPFLIKLDLSLNRISFIQPGSFIHVNGLKKLSLNGNNLQTLQFGVFDGIKALNLLNLSSNALLSFDAKLLAVASTIALDNNGIRNLNFEDFFESEIVKLSIGGNQISCKVLAELKTSKYFKKFKEMITTASLDFHSENVDGISCQSIPYGNGIDSPVANGTGYDIRPIFFQLTNAIENLRLSIEIVGNNTAPEKAYQGKSDITKILNSVQLLVDISNKTHTRLGDYLNKMKNITPLKDSKEQVINFTDKAVDVRKGDGIQFAQVTEKESKDDKVLYFIAACFGIFIVLYAINVAFGYLRKDRWSNSLYSRRPIASEMEME